MNRMRLAPLLLLLTTTPHSMMAVRAWSLSLPRLGVSSGISRSSRISGRRISSSGGISRSSSRRLWASSGEWAQKDGEARVVSLREAEELLRQSFSGSFSSSTSSSSSPSTPSSSPAKERDTDTDTSTGTGAGTDSGTTQDVWQTGIVVEAWVQRQRPFGGSLLFTDLVSGEHGDDGLLVQGLLKKQAFRGDAGRFKAYSRLLVPGAKARFLATASRGRGNEPLLVLHDVTLLASAPLPSHIARLLGAVRKGVVSPEEAATALGVESSDALSDLLGNHQENQANNANHANNANNANQASSSMVTPVTASDKASPVKEGEKDGVKGPEASSSSMQQTKTPQERQRATLALDVEIAKSFSLRLQQQIPHRLQSVLNGTAPELPPTPRYLREVLRGITSGTLESAARRSEEGVLEPQPVNRTKAALTADRLRVGDVLCVTGYIQVCAGRLISALPPLALSRTQAHARTHSLALIHMHSR